MGLEQLLNSNSMERSVPAFYPHPPQAVHRHLLMVTAKGEGLLLLFFQCFSVFPNLLLNGVYALL